MEDGGHEKVGVPASVPHHKITTIIVFQPKWERLILWRLLAGFDPPDPAQASEKAATTIALEGMGLITALGTRGFFDLVVTA